MIFLILFALFAFAGNSIFGRLALGDNHIDPITFTNIRLISGAIALAIFLFAKRQKLALNRKSNWLSSLWLMVYAFCFSLAYVSLDTGTGALILFGAVQITMFIASALQGKSTLAIEKFGVGLAFLGLVVLVFPELTSPSIVGFILMALSGMAWAVYTIRGKAGSDPSIDTSFNFIYAVPICLLVALFNLDTTIINQTGVLLAIASGVLASAAGYTVWYIILKHINVLQAGVIQLAVPIIAAVGGLIWADEAITLRLVGASVLVIGGIFLVLAKPFSQKSSSVRNN
nr:MULTISPECIES: DMT family transporter [unclassified Psychrosphaera]